MTAGSDGHSTARLLVTVERVAAAEVVVVAVGGEVDYETAADLRTAVLEAVGRGPARVVLDLAGLRFLDSSGLGVIVSGWQQARRTGVGYALRRVPPYIADQFELTGLDQLLTFEDSTAGEDPTAERDDSAA